MRGGNPRRFAYAVSVLALLILVVCAATGAAEAKKKHRHHAPPPPVPTPVPAGGGASLGAFPGNQYGNPAWDTDLRALRDFEDLTQSKPKYVEFFHAMSDSGYFLGVPPAVKAAADGGYVPVITWEAQDYPSGAGYSPHDIAAGAYDAQIANYAGQVAAIGSEVDIRLFHELNGSWYPWGVGKAGASDQDHVDAWRHVRDLFAANGATNARFVWNPNERHNQWTDSHPYADYYPGDAYVDYLALDGYNWADAHGAPWYPFDQIYRDSYAELTALSPDKPVMVAEHASHTCCGGEKGQWIRDEEAVIPTDYPRVEALLWFESNQEGAQWRVDTSQASLDAYAELANNPYFGG